MANNKLLVLLTVLLTFITNSYSFTSEVKEIKEQLISKFSIPSDKNSLISAKVLLNTNKYALSDWWKAKFGTNDTVKYLDFHGIHEHNIRPIGMQALGLAVALKTGIYDEKVVGKSISEATKKTVHLITSLAYRHRVNLEKGWGNEWQSALWAHYIGFAAWLLWDKIDVTEKEHIEKMIVYESNRFINYTVPYYQNKEGKVITPGDTKAEENSWNSGVLQIATAMMPNHKNHKLWMKKNIELLISSYVRPSDLHSNQSINGKPLKEWIHGSNVFEDGTLVNHNIIHPDYITDIYTNMRAAVIYALAGMPTPAAALYNDGLIYSALTTHVFKSPPYRSPGGSIYVKDSSGKPTDGIYFPQGNDWGTHRRVHFALFDTCMEVLSTSGKKYNASEWSLIHIESQLKLQERFTDGKTYGAHNEDTYQSREEWVSTIAAINYITRWIAHNTHINISNALLE